MQKYIYPHIAMTVDDIVATKKFYTEIGFVIKEDTYSQEKHRHFLLLQGYGLEIEIFHFDSQLQNQKIGTEDLKLIGTKHIAFPVENLDEFRHMLTRKEITLSKNIETSSLGVKNINIIDPSGLIIEFFEKFQ